MTMFHTYMTSLLQTYMNMSYPYMTVFQPYMTMSHPYMAMSHPYMTMSHPYITMLHPYMTISHPYVTMSHPYVTMSHPYMTISQGISIFQLFFNKTTVFLIRVMYVWILSKKILCIGGPCGSGPFVNHFKGLLGWRETTQSAKIPHISLVYRKPVLSNYKKL